MASRQAGDGHVVTRVESLDESADVRAGSAGNRLPELFDGEHHVERVGGRHGTSLGAAVSRQE